MIIPMLIFVVSGCAPQSTPAQDGPRSARISSQGANDPRERLRDELGEFMVSFDRTLSRVEAAAARQEAGDPEMLQNIFTRRDLIEQKFTEAFAEPDPFVALVELWYDAYRLNSWSRSSDEANSLLGKGSAPQRILDRIRNIGRRWIQPGIFDELDKRIRQRADQDEETQQLINSRKRELAPNPRLIDRNESNGIVGVLGLPLAPFTASESISRTAVEVGLEARRIADRIDRLPIDLGTELDLVILEVLASPQVTNLMNEVDRFNNEFSIITGEIIEIERIVDRLPTRIREETQELFSSLEGQSEELLVINASLRETIDSGGHTLESLTTASRSLNELAIQLEQTSETLDRIFGFSTADRNEVANDTNTLIEVRNVADSINDTALSLQALIESPGLGTVADRLDQSIDQAGETTNRTLSSAIDRLVSSLGILLIVAFILGGLLVWFAARLRRSTK
ncbi:MAG: hypothetical protein MK085_01185 [Phycisphaerales bacterium]|nr:hypothetical protein [Phycisphaerales bacterium]